MCLSKAYVDKNGNKELLMEDVASLDIEDNKLRLKTLFGEQKELTASIKQIDFMTHSIFLAEVKPGETG